ncbi:MAG: type II toxin-antitoxin system HicB family antitoxin [Phycisphaerales bacterium]
MVQNVPQRSWRVVVHRDEDGAWCADVPAMPGCVSSGVTRAEAIDNIREAIQIWLETQTDLGRPIPHTDVDVEVVAVSP